MGWWNTGEILTHVRKKVCGSETGGRLGIVPFLRTHFGERLPFLHGVSVGCGTGGKELDLVRAGLVSRFSLIEVSDTAIAGGESKFRQDGFDSLQYSKGHYREIFPAPDTFDLVYWDSALHHMADVADALEWSHRVLKPGGLFLMCDYVGPTRWRWSEEDIELALRIRSLVPSAPEIDFRVTPGFVENDPSEMADSGRILDTLPRYFPNITLRLLGGFVYQFSLSGCHALVAERPELLRALLLIDDLLCEQGRATLALAFAVKPQA